jgi:hypothetical protein
MIISPIPPAPPCASTDGSAANAGFKLAPSAHVESVPPVDTMTTFAVDSKSYAPSEFQLAPFAV